MERLTYQQARDKIIEAYFKDEIQPFDPSFCFCGTLNQNNSSYWIGYFFKRDGFYYSASEFQKMEYALLLPLAQLKQMSVADLRSEMFDNDSSYEEALFNGMSAALDVLKEIHRSRGENVDDPAPFVKRQLVQ